MNQVEVRFMVSPKTLDIFHKASTQTDRALREFTRALLATSPVPSYVILPAKGFVPEYVRWNRRYEKNLARYARRGNTHRIRTPGGRIERRH